MERGLPPCKLVPKLRAAVDEYRQLLPVVAAMRNSALKERHWAKVFASIGAVLPRDESFTLQVGWEEGVVGISCCRLVLSCLAECRW